MVADSPFGVLDVTLADDALVVPWRRIYRQQPRVRLGCRACHGALHAKVSKCGLRFFAHDAADKPCPLTGETLQHRLLKSALAAAVRRCGWYAELEARSADGRWIADVLATSPDGSRQVAWEAQLARQHDDDTLDRTAKYHAGGFEVVWVLDRLTTLQAPHVTVEIDDRQIAVSQPLVALATSRCSNIKRCSTYPALTNPPACPGHGAWERAAPISLDQFATGVCGSDLAWQAIPALHASTNGELSPRPVHAWARPSDLDLARRIRRAHLDADAIAAATARQESEMAARQRQREQEELDRRQEEQRQRREQQHRLQEEHLRKKQEEEQRHAANKAALLQRQRDLTPVVVQLVTAETGVTSWTMQEGDAQLAMGVSVVAQSKTVAVICPVASRITPDVADRLSTVTIYVASDREHRNIAKRCHPDQKIVTMPS